MVEAIISDGDNSISLHNSIFKMDLLYQLLLYLNRMEERNKKITKYTIEFLELIINDDTINDETFIKHRDAIVKKYSDHSDVWIVKAIIRDYVGGVLFHVFREHSKQPSFCRTYPNTIWKIMWG
jgi:hypothetical protein